MVEPIKYKDLYDNERKSLIYGYAFRWRDVLREERRQGILPDTGDKPMLAEVERQFASASKVFPEGQIVLASREGSKWKPHVLVLSTVRKIESMNDYPATWYEATNCGRLADAYEPDGNTLICYAITSNPLAKIKGASQMIIEERLRFAKENKLCCDAYSTPVGYKDYMETMTIDAYLKKMLEEKIPDPVGMHCNFGADVLLILPEARHDPRSGNYCVVCEYVKRPEEFYHAA